MDEKKETKKPKGREAFTDRRPHQETEETVKNETGNDDAESKVQHAEETEETKTARSAVLEFLRHGYGSDDDEDQGRTGIHGTEHVKFQAANQGRLGVGAEPKPVRQTSKLEDLVKKKKRTQEEVVDEVVLDTSSDEDDLESRARVISREQSKREKKRQKKEIKARESRDHTASKASDQIQPTLAERIQVAPSEGAPVGEPSHFDSSSFPQDGEQPFKRKKKKTRSRQKNIRKDTREVKPAHLTEESLKLPRLRNPAQELVEQ